MENRSSTGTGDRAAHSYVVPWDWLDKRAVSAFTLSGVLLLASIVVPVGLKPVTEWAWVSGIVLVGLAVLSVAAGLLGLYPRVTDDAPHLAILGMLSAVVAGVAALGLLVMGVIALVGEGAFGVDLGKPVGIFVAVTLAMASGFSVGFLSIGAAGRRSDAISRTSSQLLLLGGALLLVPIAGEFLRRGFGVVVGIPSWVFLPVLGLVTFDALAIGYSFRTET